LREGVQRRQVIDEEVTARKVGSAILISVGKEYREWQDPMQCRKSMSKCDTCNIESRCAIRCTLFVISLLQVLKGVGSLGNEAVDCDNNISARSEEGSVTRDAVEM